MTIFKEIFKNLKPVIGMIHFPPLLGYKDYPGFEYIKDKALKDLRALERGGVNAILLENNYDTPHKIFVEPETIGAQFIRLPVFADKVKTNYGTIAGKPKTIAYESIY